MKRAWAFGLTSRVLTCDTQRNEGLGGRGERRVRADSEESARDRGRNTSRTCDPSEERITVCDPNGLFAVGDLVDRAGDRGDCAELLRRGPRELCGGVARADRFDASDLGLAAGERRDLGCVAAHDRDVDLFEQAA